ncbi:N-6 DNA methylase [Aeromonas media]|uniref:type I restriction-modification system subunit M n=1 Tax=Aeromonas media TaxID=651 RepID=UPI003CFE6C94
MSNISTLIKSIQEIMRKDTGVDGDAQRISQLVWLFFLKIYDDREAELELLEDDYQSPLKDEFRWRNWAADPEGETGDELIDFVNNKLFPALKRLSFYGENGQRARVIRSVFEDAFNYMKSGTLLRQVINKINEVDFNNSGDRHLFGSIYEQILKGLQSAGNAGEFYTPRAVTRFIIDRIDPQLGESVLDPACGTGGFLTCTIEHKRNRYVKNSADEVQLAESIHGVEKKALPHMLCTTNMILHGIDTPTQIAHDNMLSRRPYKDYGEADRVDVIVTNPPFGGMEEDGVENQFPATLRTRETADLFMALVIKLLKVQGRAAVVLPDGFLFGEGMKTRLKQMLIEECNLHTIVRLPNGVFAPYTGIKTNILFFTKGQPTKEIWFYEHPYPAGVKNYSKTKPMKFEEFEAEIAWWGNEADGFASRVETEQAWKVSIDDIVARNFNLDIKNPHVGELVSHDPDEILASYAKEQAKIQALRDELKTILNQALGKNIAKQEEQV